MDSVLVVTFLLLFDFRLQIVICISLACCIDISCAWSYCDSSLFVQLGKRPSVADWSWMDRHDAGLVASYFYLCLIVGLSFDFSDAVE